MAENPVVKLELPAPDFRNLLTYLEHVLTGERGFRTKLIHEDVLRLMREIKKQTGIDLDAGIMPAEVAGISDDHDCAKYLSQSSGRCLVCGGFGKNG